MPVGANRASAISTLFYLLYSVLFIVYAKIKHTYKQIWDALQVKEGYQHGIDKQRELMLFFN